MGVQVTGGDDTGGEGDAKEGGEHGDATAYGRNWVNIAIAHGGERIGSPVESIKKEGKV